MAVRRHRDLPHDIPREHGLVVDLAADAADSRGLSRHSYQLKCTLQSFARYCGGMSEMTVTHARARLADVVDAARVAHDPVYLTRRGHRVAAVIDAQDLDRLIAAAEDLADLEAAQAARDEMDSGAGAIPWEQVKADLGLV
jgi:antitoxin Phd